MNNRLPPLNWLRAFEASARLLNFTQAANELNLTQAAVSQHVKGLESHLDAKLFVRLPRGLELTEIGKAYLPMVTESIDQLAEATKELFGGRRNRRLTVRVNLIFYVDWLAPKLAEFRNRYPDISLRITSNIWPGEQQVDADLDIRYGTGSWKGYDVDRLTEDRLIPVCSPKVLDSCQPDNIWLEQPLLHVIGYKEGWSHWFNENATKGVDPGSGIQFDTLISSIETAKQGLGIALGRTSVVQRLLDEGALIAPFAGTASTTESFYLLRKSQEYQSQNALLFRSWLLSQI